MKINDVEKLGCGCEYKITQIFGESAFAKTRIKTCETHEPKVDTEKLKQQKINEIRQETKKKIQNKYSIEEQINCLNLLNGRSEIEKADCIEYIENISLQGQQFQGEVLALTEIEDIQNYTFEFITE